MHWLFKSEPNTFSFQDLLDSPGKRAEWEGVRNYQARNFMKQMKKKERGFFYHSVVKPMAIMGVVEIVKEAYPDHYAFDPDSDYYDPKSSPDEPRWFMVDVKAVKTFKEPITRDELKNVKGLEKMELLKKGSRLSIQPVRDKEFEIIMNLR